MSNEILKHVGHNPDKVANGEDKALRFLLVYFI